MTKLLRVFILLLFLSSPLFGQDKELYVVNPESAACETPQFPGTYFVTESAATFTWALPSSSLPASFEIELLEVGQAFTGTANHSNIISAPFLINNLLAGKTYKFRVRSVCVGGLNSNWSIEHRFRTNLLNPQCNLNLVLADTSCVPETNHFRIKVNQAQGTELGTDVELRAVRFTMAHTWASDMKISLVSPSGVRIVLIDSLPTGGNHFGNINDPNCGNYTELSSSCALKSIKQGQDPFIGTFIPIGRFGDFNDGSNPNGVWTLEACDRFANDIGILKYLELVFEPMACIAPSAAIVQNVSLNGAYVMIPAGMGCDSLYVEYGPKGFRPGNANLSGPLGTLLKTSCSGSQVILSGLAPFTEYSVFLRKLCSPGLFSPSGCRTDFYTDCSFPSEEETFNTQQNCPMTCASPCTILGHWQNMGGDDFDWSTSTFATPTPTTGPDNDFEGTGKYAYIEVSGAACGLDKTAVLQSHCLTVVDQLGDCDLAFAYHMYGQTMGTLRIEASTNGGQTWAILWSRTGNQGNQWLRQKIDLQAYDGQTILLRFVARSFNGAYGDIGLDNIRFFGATFQNHGATTYYRDADNDGFGNDNIFLRSCAQTPPVGYITQNGDCNDANPSVYPGAVEIYCNGIDDNCNGMQDDIRLPAPVINSVAACAESQISLAASQPYGSIYWYSNAQNGQLLGVGTTLSMIMPSANTQIVAKDSLAGCPGAWDTVQLSPYPKPQLGLNQLVELCTGKSLNLMDLPITDGANTNTSYTFYQQYPFTPAQIIAPAIVSPSMSRSYYVHAVTNQLCRDTLTIPVTVNQLPTVQIAQGDTLKLCKGSQSILNAQGSGSSFLPYTYLWSNGLGFANIPVFSAAQSGITTYTVTVTHAKGCSSTDQIKLQTLSSITQTDIVNVGAVSACGGSDGSITLRPLNGIPPFTFSWSGSQGSGTLQNIAQQAIIAGLSEGSYRVTITDSSPNGGCGMVMPLIFIDAPNFKIDTVISQAAVCHGSLTGSISLQIIGQNPTVSWSNGKTGSTITGLAAGMYSATVSDGSCEQVIQGIEVTQPDLMTIVANQITTARCHDEASGAVQIFVSGGNGNYTYQWTNGSTQANLTNRFSGTYTVTVTDQRACTSSASFFIPEPPQLQVQLDTLAQPKCYGDKTGYIGVSFAGGVQPYLFSWENQLVAQQRNMLAAGQYILTLTDSRLCTTVFNKTIVQPDSLQLQLALVQQPSCEGVSDGAILVSALGGVQPYKAHWSVSNIVALTLGSIKEGFYSATITDANQCVALLDTVELDAPQTINVSNVQVQNVACFGQNTGKISLNVNHQNPYTVYLNNQIGGLSNAQLTAGAYALEVRNTAGCRFLDTIILTQPQAPLTLELGSLDQALCANTTGGSITMHTLGGTQPYQYLWSNGQTSESIQNTIPAIYQLTITDDLGCTSVSSQILVSEPPQLVVDITKADIPCFGGSTGSIQLTVTGGVAPYAYDWNTNDNTAAIYFLPAGQYSATVVDANQCILEVKTIKVLDLKQDFEVSVLSTKNLTCNNQTGGEIIIQATNSNPPYTYIWSQPIGPHVSAYPNDTVSNLLSGNYKVTVTNSVGCSAVSQQIEVFNPPLLEVSLDTIIANACKGDDAGVIVLNIFGGVPPYIFNWSDGGTSTGTRVDLVADTYYVEAMDFNQCRMQLGPFVVGEPLNGINVQLDTLNGAVKDDPCGNCKGEIYIKVDGGQPGYLYRWNDNSINQDRNNLCEGHYNITVTDLTGCTRSLDSIWVAKLSETPGLETVRITDIACKGDSSGVIATTISGGVEPISLFWSNNMSGDTIVGLPAGIYTTTISDAASCSSTYIAVVREPQTNLSISHTSISANGGANGSIALQITGGWLGYTVSWSPNANGQTEPSINNIENGIYTATVTDMGGCTIAYTVGLSAITTIAIDQVAVKISPNPVNEVLELHFSQPMANSSNLYCQIFDNSGRVLIREVLQAGSGQYQVRVSELPQGFYRLKLTDDQGRSNQLPFVKIGY
jgi:subtilisin-like proprotein convertase family protein